MMLYGIRFFSRLFTWLIGLWQLARLHFRVSDSVIKPLAVVVWQPPPLEHYKCNIDIANDSYDLGMEVRNSLGIVVKVNL